MGLEKGTGKGNKKQLHRVYDSWKLYISDIVLYLHCLTCVLGSIASAAREFLQRALDSDLIPEAYCDIVKFDRLADDVVLSSTHQYNVDGNGQPVEVFRKYEIPIQY